jgi:hypothetical protein
VRLGPGGHGIGWDDMAVTHVVIAASLLAMEATAQVFVAVDLVAVEAVA